MAEIKDYIWIFPLIAGIFLIIAILTPAVVMNLYGLATDSLWFWGLYAVPTFYYIGSSIEFITDTLVLIPSLITTAVLIVSAILLIYSAMKLRKGRSELSSVKNLSIGAALLTIFGIIFWLIMIPLFFPLDRYFGDLIVALPPGYELNFWTLEYMGVSLAMHSPGFGVVGGFIGAGLAFVAAGIAHYYSKERPIKVPEKTPTLKEPTMSTTEASETEKLTVCPECGAKIEDPNAKFCGSCGAEYKK